MRQPQGLRPGRFDDHSVYHARGYDFWRDFGAACAGASDGRRSGRGKSELRAKVDELIAEQRKAKEAGDIGEIEKHGVNTGRYAINPFNGEKVPIWVANYILMDYGTGAIMSVPAHDERDYEFAKKYKIEIRLVILPISNDPEETMRAAVAVHLGHDGTLINSGQFSGLACDDAIKKMSAYAEENGFGKATVTYRLKDWGISRQRYWGTPIPMLYCEKDGIVPVPEKDLPVILPENVEITLDRRVAAGTSAGVCEYDVPEMRRTGAARNRHHGHVRRFVLVFLSLHRRAQ